MGRTPDPFPGYGRKQFAISCAANEGDILNPHFNRSSTQISPQYRTGHCREYFVHALGVFDVPIICCVCV